jgi:hypothetical protein
MPGKKEDLKTCENGHRFTKTSDCPVCPICEQARKPKVGFMHSLAAPARRALENNKINTLKQLSQLSEEEVLRFHGMGKSSLPKLKAAMEAEGLSFKKNEQEIKDCFSVYPNFREICVLRILPF